MLDYFNGLGINVYKLSLEGFYVARILHFKIISFENFIMLEDVGSMTVCYTLEGFMPLGDFDFMKLV